MRNLLMVAILAFIAVFAMANDRSPAEAAKREEYRKSMEEKLARIGRELDELEVQAKKAKGDAKAKFEDQVANLEQRRKALKKDLDGAATTTGRAWEQLRTGLDKAFSELRRGFENARREIKDGAEKPTQKTER